MAENTVKKIATRESYGNSLKELAEEFPNLVVLDADLAAATKTGIFRKADILVTLMGSAILTYCDTCMSCTDLHIQMRVTDRVTYLLECTSCCKHCK